MVSPFNLAWNLLKGFDSRYPPAIEAYRERSDDERYYPPVTMAHDAHDHLDDPSKSALSEHELGAERESRYAADTNEYETSRIGQMIEMLQEALREHGYGYYEDEQSGKGEFVPSTARQPPDPAQHIEDWYN
jgi:hypothetical protein